MAIYHSREKGSRNIRLPDMHTIMEEIIVILATACFLTRNPAENRAINVTNILIRTKFDKSAAALSARAYNTCPSKAKDKCQAPNNTKLIINKFV